MPDVIFPGPEGRLEGRVEGRVEGQVRTLLALIRLRYGDVSPDVVARIQAASDQERDAWSARIFTALTVEELLG